MNLLGLIIAYWVRWINSRRKRKKRLAYFLTIQCKMNIWKHWSHNLTIWILFTGRIQSSSIATTISSRRKASTMLSSNLKKNGKPDSTNKAKSIKSYLTNGDILKSYIHCFHSRVLCFKLHIMKWIDLDGLCFKEMFFHQVVCQIYTREMPWSATDSTYHMLKLSDGLSS